MQDVKTSAPKSLSLEFVSGNISVNLVAPESGSRSWHPPPTTFATVPEAAVNKNRKTKLRKEKVRLPRHISRVLEPAFNMFAMEN
jgi:hypothetical protein